MGGFTVNGCGTGDSFHPIRILGNHYCKHCKSIQEYDLMEVKRKIKVFYIPTVAINTKYAVACKKCKNGSYIEDSIRDDLMYGRKEITVESGGIYYKNVAGDIPVQPNHGSSQNVDNNKDKSDEKGLTIKCGKCGAELAAETKFCGRCGAPVECVSFCPTCGAKLQQGQAFCMSCGVKLK